MSAYTLLCVVFVSVCLCVCLFVCVFDDECQILPMALRTGGNRRLRPALGKGATRARRASRERASAADATSSDN